MRNGCARKMIKITKFRNKKTGEIKRRILITEIADYEKVTVEVDETKLKTLWDSISVKQRNALLISLGYNKNSGFQKLPFDELAKRGGAWIVRDLMEVFQLYELKTQGANL